VLRADLIAAAEELRSGILGQEEWTKLLSLKRITIFADLESLPFHYF